MACDKCKQWRSTLYSTFDDCKENLDLLVASRPQSFCSDCLVGQTLPAFRLSTEEWNFGLVFAHRRDTNEFCVLFDDCQREWLHLEQAPFEAYVRFYQDRLDPMHEEDVTPFDSQFWNRRSSLSGNDSNHIDYSCSSAVMSTPTKQRSSPLSQSNSKSSPRLWTTEEDSLLLRALNETPQPWKWPDIAQLVPWRTGKQCRERYFNHLMPNVKQNPWSPVEDAQLYRLYSLLGSKWAMFSRLLPGRTDNAIKNRFHYMRRQLEKHASGLPHPAPYPSLKDKVLVTGKMARPDDELQGAVADILANNLGTGKKLLVDEPSDYFGPFATPRQGKPCVRCGLLAPSAQTGSSVCTRSGWCIACTEVPSFLRDDQLRLEHSIRSSDSKRVSLGDG